MDSLTLVTFLVFHPKARSFELLGSWDNFTTPYVLEKDSRKGHGNWTGCFIFKDIIFDGDVTQVTQKRDGGLKMGGTYWYYYRLDQNIEFFDPTKPSTTSCPLLPGQRLNVLEVPIARAMFGHSNDIAGDVAVRLPVTLNPSDRFTAIQPPPNRKRVSSSDPCAQPHRNCGGMTNGSSHSSLDSVRSEDIYGAAFKNDLHRQDHCFSPADRTRNKDNLALRSLAAPMKWALQHLRNQHSATISKDGRARRNVFRNIKQSASKRTQLSVQKTIDISSPALVSGTNLVSHITSPAAERVVLLAPPGSPVDMSSDLHFEQSEYYLDHDRMVSTALPRTRSSRRTTSRSRSLDDIPLDLSPSRRHPVEADGELHNMAESPTRTQPCNRIFPGKHVGCNAKGHGNLHDRAKSSGENRSRPLIGSHRYSSSEEVHSHVSWRLGDGLAASTSYEDQIVNGYALSFPSARAPRNGLVAINNFRDVAIRNSQIRFHMDDCMYDPDQPEMVDSYCREDARSPGIRLAPEQPKMPEELCGTSDDFSTSHDLWASRYCLQTERPNLMRSQFSQWTYTSEESGPSSPRQAADEDQSPTFSSVEEIASDVGSPCRLAHTTRHSSFHLVGDGAWEPVGDIPTCDYDPVVDGNNDGALAEGTDFRRQAGLFDLPQGFYDSDPPEKMDPADPEVEENPFDAAFLRSVSSLGLEGTSTKYEAISETTTTQLRGSVTESTHAISPNPWESSAIRAADYPHYEKITPVGELVNEFGHLGDVVF